MKKGIEFVNEDEYEEKDVLHRMLRREIADNIKNESKIKDIEKKTLQECSVKIDEHNKELQRAAMSGATPSEMVGKLNKNVAKNMLKNK